MAIFLLRLNLFAKIEINKIFLFFNYGSKFKIYETRILH